MKTALIIVGVIFVPIILYLCAVAFGFLDMKIHNIFGLIYKKSENEQADDVHTKKTGYSKRRKAIRYIFLAVTVVFFLILSIIAFLGEGVVIGTMMAVLGSLVTILPLSLCLQVWLSYEIIEEDGILVHRVFGKRFVKYPDMSYYKTNCGAYDGQIEICVYNSQNKRLIWMSGDRVGTRAVLNALEKNKISLKIIENTHR